MPNHTSKTFVYQLLGNVSNQWKTKGQTSEGTEPREAGDLHVVTRVSHRSTLPLIELTLPRPDEVDRNLNVLSDQLLPQELSSFVGIVGLLRVRLSRTNRGRK